MNAACREVQSEPPSVPLALLWKDPEDRFSLEIPFRLLDEWLAFFGTSQGSGIGFLTATKPPRTVGGRDGYVLGFETIASSDPTGLQEKVRTRSQNADNDLSLVGIASRQSADGFQFNDRKYFSELMEAVLKPHLFLSVNPHSDGATATLFSWDATSHTAQPIGVAFPLTCDRLEAQYYAPFTPVFFAHSSTERAATPEQVTSCAARVGATIPADVPQHRHFESPANGNKAPFRREPEPQHLVGRFRHMRQIAVWTACLAAFAIVGVGVYSIYAVRGNRQEVQTAGSTREVVAKENSSNVGLTVSLKGTVMEIGWDPRSSPAKSAQSGRVEIRDGEEKVSVLLDPAQLASGRVLYSPRSPEMRIQLQMTTPSGIVEESVRVLRAGSGGISGTEVSGTRARSSAPVRVEPPPVAEDPTERPPSVGKIFVPPVRKSNAPVETDVIEPPQLNFASSSSLPQVKLPKVDVRVPLPVQTALAAPVVVPPVALTDLAVYIPLAWRTPDVAGREVSVKVHVDNQGRVASVDAGKLSPRLAAAIADAAKRWRFNPATASGKAVPSEMTIHLRFPANR